MTEPFAKTEYVALYRVYSRCRLLRGQLPPEIVDVVEDAEQLYLANGFDADGVPRQVSEAAAAAKARRSK